MILTDKKIRDLCEKNDMIFPFKEKIWWIPLFCLERQGVSGVTDRAHININKNINLIKTHYQM